MDYLEERVFSHIGWFLRWAPSFAALFLASLLLLHRNWLASVRAGWRESRTNFVYFAIGGLVYALLAGLAVELLRPLLEIGPALSVAAWPVWVQGVVAIIAWDFVVYWQHRMKHHPWLWPIHAVHHSDTHLTWMTQFRRHPLDTLIASSSVLVALSVLGFDGPAAAAGIAAVRIWGYVIHMRLPVDPALLGYVLVTPRIHERHHARDPDLHDCNFAVLFSVWDRVFGTYRPPVETGIETGADPLTPGHGWVDHMVYPFREYWRIAAGRMAQRRQAR